MTIKLPVFQDYTVDERLREFRQADYGQGVLEIIPFDSEQGRRLLAAYYAQAMGTKIEVDADDPDAWLCMCGNRPDLEGFYPCDESGMLEEPTQETWTSGLYRCERCGRVIQQETRTIVGVLEGHVLDRETLQGQPKMKA